MGYWLLNHNKTLGTIHHGEKCYPRQNLCFILHYCAIDTECLMALDLLEGLTILYLPD